MAVRQPFQHHQVILICRVIQTALSNNLFVLQDVLATIAAGVAKANGVPVNQVLRFLAPECIVIPVTPVTT